MPMIAVFGMSSRMLALHAPDGMFSPSVNLVFAVLVIVVVGLALRRLSRQGDHRLAPAMGVMAAFVFAAQMVNFPVASGTTGHLLGGTLTAILLGPWAGTVVMAVVIVFQGMLGDGGISALGPNTFNMGIIGTLLSYFVYRLALGAERNSSARVVAASSFAAWLAVVLASVFACVQLAVSSTVSLAMAFPAMVGFHMLIGVGEALITAGVVAFVLKTRPDLLYDPRQISSRTTGRGVILVGLGGALVVGLFLSLLPTLWDHPDGLEYVGIEKGFVFEEFEKTPDGELAKLPAYPFGVRLAMVDGAVTVVHRYEALYRSKADEREGVLKVGDVLRSVGGVSVSSLHTVAESLRFNEEAKSFGIRPGDEVAVSVVRGGENRSLVVPALAAPAAGARLPMIALLPDYTVPGVSGLLGVSLAGGLGTLVMFVVSLLVGRMFTRPGRLETAYQQACGKNDSAGGPFSA